MFLIQKNKEMITIRKFSMSGYRVITVPDPSNYALQSIYYDHPCEFSASLNVQSTTEKFNTLTFSFHSKNGSNNDIIFNVLNEHPNIQIFYSKNQQQYVVCLQHSQDRIRKLLASILLLNEQYELVKDIFSSAIIELQAKNFLTKLTNIVDLAIRYKDDTDLILSKLSSLYEEEIFSLQALESSVSEMHRGL